MVLAMAKEATYILILTGTQDGRILHTALYSLLLINNGGSGKVVGNDVFMVAAHQQGYIFSLHYCNNYIICIYLYIIIQK